MSKERAQELVPEDLRGLARVGILVISDRASRGEYEDISGKAINDFLNRTVQSNWIAVIKIVPDGIDSVAKALVEMSDGEGCDLVLTTGGTGPSPRDLTPEGTRQVITRELEGFGELMRRVSLQQVPTAILSRQIAGTRGNCLIVNLPGRPSAIDVCLSAVFPAIPYCLDLIGARPIEVNPNVCHAFRPERMSFRSGTPGRSRRSYTRTKSILTRSSRRF